MSGPGEPVRPQTIFTFHKPSVDRLTRTVSRMLDRIVTHVLARLRDTPLAAVVGAEVVRSA